MPVNHDNARDASRAVGVRMSRSTRDGEPQVSPVDRKDSSLYVKPSYTINSGVTSVSTVKRFSTRVSALERQRRTKLQEKKRKRDLEKKKTIKAIKLFDYIEKCKKRELADKREKSLQKVLKQRKVMAYREKKSKTRREESARIAAEEKKVSAQERRLARLLIGKIDPSKDEDLQRRPSLKQSKPKSMKEVLNEKRRALFAKYSSVKAGGIAASADETEVVANSQLSCNDGPDGRELAQILTVYTKSDIPIPIKIKDKKKEKREMLRNEKKKALDKMVAATAENKLKCLNLVSPEDTIKSDSIQLSKNEAPTKQDSLKSAEVKLYLSSLIAEAELLKLKKKTLVSQANKPSGKQVLSGYNPNYSNPSFENIHLRSSAKKEPQLPRKDVSNEKLPPITNTKISFIDMSIDDIEGKTVYVTRTKSSDKNPSLILRSRPQYHDSKIEVKGSPSVTQTQSFLEPEPVKSDFFFKPRASGKPRFWVIPRSG